jgi:serine/threonine-protein kinase 11
MSSPRISFSSSVGAAWTPHFIVESVDRSSVKCVNQYAKLSVIGRGAFGKVFAAWDREANRLFAMKQIAVKTISRSMLGISQLQHEIELLRTLEHPNIISLREVLYSKPSTLFIITDFAECGSLESILKLSKLPQAATQFIFKEIATGIAYLHSHRMVHQDIKPGNVLIGRDGRVMLTDFGMSHSFDTPPAVFGTPHYHAPEALDVGGEIEGIGGREDVWSLGVTLYELIFGTTPFSGKNVYEIIASVTDSDLLPPSPVDPEIWEIIKGMITVDPKERFDMDQVMDSRYVKSAPAKMEFPYLPVIKIPEFDPRKNFLEQSAVPCGPDYEFNFVDPKSRADGGKFRCFSSPF